MKKTRKIFALVVAMMIVMGCFFTSHAETRGCALSPTGEHDFSAHERQGAGYSQQLSSHNHYMGVGPNGEMVYVTCQRTQYFEYCYKKCVYCHAVNMQEPAHTHSYKVHSADGSIEYVD